VSPLLLKHGRHYDLFQQMVFSLEVRTMIARLILVPSQVIQLWRLRSNESKTL